MRLLLHNSQEKDRGLAVCLRGKVVMLLAGELKHMVSNLHVGKQLSCTNPYQLQMCFLSIFNLFDFKYKKKIQCQFLYDIMSFLRSSNADHHRCSFISLMSTFFYCFILCLISFLKYNWERGAGSLDADRGMRRESIEACKSNFTSQSSASKTQPPHPQQ